jgi:hypothetical protein
MAWNATASRAPKVGVCVPIKGQVSIEWAFSFAQMLMASGGVEVGLYSNGHYEIDYARNDLVDQARRDGCTHVFFLDADIIPWWFTHKDVESVVGRPFPEILRYMLEVGYPIVSGLYWLKRPPGGANLALIRNEDAFTIEEIKMSMGDAVDYTIYVDAVGLGACLIDIRVFDHIPYPWFVYHRDPKRQENGTFKELSEDFYFGRKASLSGFSVLCLGSVLCKHEGRVFFTWDGNANGVLGV